MIGKGIVCKEEKKMEPDPELKVKFPTWTNGTIDCQRRKLVENEETQRARIWTGLPKGIKRPV